MKTIIGLFLIAFAINIEGQESGIRFFTGSFEEVKSLAVKTGKPIFIDVYTTWCGPCKRLSKEVFVVDEVADYFNKNFINYQVDAERGEGIRLSRVYRVMAYPTLLFTDANGKLIHQMRGFRPYEPFLDEAKTVIDTTHEATIAQRYLNDKAYRAKLDEERKEKLAFLKLLKSNKKLDSLHSLYEDGSRNIDFMAEYLIEREKLKVCHPDLIDEYFDIRKRQKLKGINHVAIHSMKLKSCYEEDFEKILNDLNTRSDKNPEQESFILSQLQRTFDHTWEEAIRKKDTTDINTLLEKQESILDLNDIETLEKSSLIGKKKLHFFRETGMSNSYHELAHSIIIKRNAEINQADSVAKQTLALENASLLLGYENLALKKGQYEDLLALAKSNLEVYKHPDIYAPLLLLHHKLSQSNEAMTIMREGMIHGKKNDQNTQQLFKLFGRIKKPK